jgi:ectoine hydroxylase-related dioxygenase (phytanoyl-CoA dioxygenase family)
MDVPLTDAQVAFFEENGYLRLDRITTDEDVARLRISYDRIFRERAGRDEGNQFDLAGTNQDDAEESLPQILEPALYAPEMNESLLLRNADRICKQLLGEHANCVVAHAILKPAHHGGETPWHQDAAYWDPNLISPSISIWVPLQPVDEENGCMEFVPGSHKLDVVAHRSIGDDPRVHGLELDPSASHHIRNPVSCPLPAGGCTIHGGYMLHHAGPNHTNEPRRALIMAAWVKGRPRDKPISFPWQQAWKTKLGEKQRARQETG